MHRYPPLLLLAAALGCICQRPSNRPFRLGFFPNLTHAQALVGDHEGDFKQAVGQAFEIKRFNAGPSAMEALFANELDASYVGSGPAINAYLRSHGALRIIAGSTAGGAVLVAKTATKPEDLRGKKVASPQLGNTQDIALRHWLLNHGLKPSGPGGGDVTVVPISNADILSLFKRGEVEGAWVPEPWGARLVAEGGGHILVDERDLWPGGMFPTTVVVASKRALESRREQLKAILRVHVGLTRRAQADPLQFARVANVAFEKLTGNALPDKVLREAFSRLSFTVDPLPTQLKSAAEHAQELGFIPSADIDGLVDRSLLDEILAEEKARAPDAGTARPTPRVP